MKFKNKAILSVNPFLKRNTNILDYANILEKYAAIGGFSWPIPTNLYIYYFVTTDQQNIVFETYQLDDKED